MENNTPVNPPVKPPDIPVATPVQPPNILNIKLSGLVNSVVRQKKVVATIFGILLLTAAVGTGVVLVQQEQKTKVSAGSAELSLSSNNKSPKPGDTFVVAVALNTEGLNVSAADIRVRYDGTLLQAVKADPVTSFLPVILSPGKIDNLDNPLPRASWILGALIDSSGTHPKSGTGLLGTITFKALKAGKAQISFGGDTAVAAVGQDSDVAGTKTGIAVTIVSPTPSPAPTPTKTANPACPTPPQVTGLSPSGTINCTSKNATQPVTFKWNAAANAQKYELRIDDTVNGWVFCGQGTSNPNDFCIYNITGTSYTQSLQSGKTYNWWVSALNSCGGDIHSAQVTITIPKCN